MTGFFRAFPGRTTYPQVAQHREASLLALAAASDQVQIPVPFDIRRGDVVDARPVVIPNRATQRPPHFPRGR